MPDVVLQGNVNILQQLQSARRSGASSELLLKNLMIQFYLNNMTSSPANFRQYDNMEIVS